MGFFQTVRFDLIQSGEAEKKVKIRTEDPS
jgi:hypothetical protein